MNKTGRATRTDIETRLRLGMAQLAQGPAFAWPRREGFQQKFCSPSNAQSDDGFQPDRERQAPYKRRT